MDYCTPGMGLKAYARLGLCPIPHALNYSLRNNVPVNLASPR